MRKPRAVELDGSRGSALTHLCWSHLRGIPLHFHIRKHQGRRFLVTKGLGIAAACMAAGLVAFIAVEAFDADVSLWPVGTEEFMGTANASSPADVEPLQCSTALTAIPVCVIATGAHPIAQHLAQSALATDDPSISPPHNVAERREVCLAAAPRLGHFYYTGPGDGRNAAGRARRQHLVSSSRALPLASRFLS